MWKLMDMDCKINGFLYAMLPNDVTPYGKLETQYSSFIKTAFGTQNYISVASQLGSFDLWLGIYKP